MTTQDAIRLAELETTEKRNQRGWTEEEIQSAMPIGKSDEFFRTWQALMSQLETVLSLAHRETPSPAQTAEAVSSAQFYLTQIGKLLERKTQSGQEKQDLESITGQPHQRHVPGHEKSRDVHCGENTGHRDRHTRDAGGSVPGAENA